MQVFSKKKKVFKILFQAISKKKRSSRFFFRRKRSSKIFSGDLYLRKPKKKSLQIFRKVSGVFQRNFNGSKIVMSSSRRQGNFRRLEASRPRTSKCVLEAKDILKDSTSGYRISNQEPQLLYRYVCYHNRTIKSVKLWWGGMVFEAS